MADYTPSKTLMANNKFRFTCPIFNAETEIATCFKLRDMVWRGHGPEQRKGCQCAMAASKCPVVHVLTVMMRSTDDPYHSTEPVMGKLRPEIHARIAPILVPERLIENSGAGPREIELLRAANEAARNHFKDTATPVKVKRQGAGSRPVLEAVTAPAPAEAPNNEFAISTAKNDLAALVSTMVAQEGKEAA